MKLHYFETPNGRKACAVAKYLNSPVEFVRVDLTKGEHKRPEFLAINPNGKIPALEDGEQKLWESNAIMCHLARKAKSDLWPDDERQIDIIRWMQWETAHFSRHAGTLFFEHTIRPLMGSGADMAMVAEAEGFFRQFAQVLAGHLAGRPYLVGDRLSVADFAAASVLPYARDAKLPLDGFPEVARWHARMNEIPAWRDPFPIKTAAAA